MSEQAANANAQNPFSPKAVLGLVVFGAATFVLLLWMVGAGMTSGSPNDGGGHAGGKGLNGYSALADFLQKRGHTVRRSMSEATLDDPGLLVLTPPQGVDGKVLEEIVSKRRYVGPTLVVTPKWIGTRPISGTPGAKKGWVNLVGTQPPSWPGFLDDVGVKIETLRTPGWRGGGGAGALPRADAVLSGSGPRLAPLALSRPGNRILAAYIADDGFYPVLEHLAIDAPAYGSGEDEDIYPLIVVFEPDLIDNWGMASRENALFADRLFAAAVGDGDGPIVFDLTLNGHKRSPNLLTLAFTPPFLAATLCLIIAALAAGWRAFLRFGPARRGARAIAFGKRALVANTAGLIRRSRRLHLIPAPYATAARERLARALALPRQPDAEATEAAIDRALLGRDASATPFSAIAGQLRSARKPEDMIKAARDLHSLERNLTR